MRGRILLSLALSLSVNLLVVPNSQAAISKPSAPKIDLIYSSSPKKGKVDVTVTITLPIKSGGSKITGSKVTADGKTCTMNNSKDTCKIKGVKLGKSITVKASSKNKKGFGNWSKSVRYKTGTDVYISDLDAPAPTPTPTPTPTPITYTLGDIGPGGGLIFLVVPDGFNCGVNFSATGSPTGGKCKYLEVAPRNWSDIEVVGSRGPGVKLCAASMVGVLPTTPSADLLTNIGEGARNTQLMYAAFCGAAFSVKYYEGGGKGDWYIPSSAELNALCRYSRDPFTPLTYTSSCYGNGGTFQFGGFEFGEFGLSEMDNYLTSTSSGNYFAIQNMANGERTGGGAYDYQYLRPIRAF